MKKGVVMTGIICIAALEAIALLKGHNGALLTMTVGAIAAVIGVAIPTPKALQ